MGHSKVFVVCLAAASALAACGGDDGEATSTPASEGGSGTIQTVPELEPLVTSLLDAYADEGASTRPELVLTPRNELVQAVSEGTPGLAVLPGAWLESVDTDADSVVLGRNLAIVAVPTGNPAGVTGLDAFASEAGLETAVCGPEGPPYGNFAALVLQQAGVRPDIGEVDSGCDADAVAQVASGELDAALVFRGGVVIPEGVEVIDVPEEQNVVFDVRYVQLSDDESTSAFATFFETDQATEILTQQGYLP